MKYWYDCEFLEDGRTIDLISIGIVSEDGRELYLVNEEASEGHELYRKICAHEWLMNNVVPGLPLHAPPGRKPHAWIKLMRNEPGRGYFSLDPGSNSVVSRRFIRNAVRNFIWLPGDGEQVELWAWCGAYDHVALMQLFGSMMDKPSWFPSYTHDFQDLLDGRGISDDQLPVQTEGQHNALADARHLQYMMRHLEETKQ